MGEAAEVIVDEVTLNERLADLARKPPVIGAVAVVILLIGAQATGLTPWGPLFGQGEAELIGFDQARARSIAEELVALGPRHSGSDAELQGAKIIAGHLESAGFDEVEILDFSVPMFEITREPLFEFCRPGINPFNACGPFLNTEPDIILFNHTREFVLQGYSGSRVITFDQNVPVVDLGNGSDDVLWQDAENSIGLLWSAGSVGGNTIAFLNAQANGLLALIVVYAAMNCDQIVDGDCVPIFKTVDVTQFTSIPSDIPFMMVSRSVGELIREEVVGGDARLQMDIEVDNTNTRDIRVVCGTIFGKDETEIILGAHHDTVYNGPGAVDDTSGTATVVEMGYQFGFLYQELGQPDHTLRICTWGGEEEGLHGSKAYVASRSDELSSRLQLYANFDMNHVDLERGASMTLFGNDAETVAQIEEVLTRFTEASPNVAQRYNVSVQVKNSIMDDPNGMPYNSDHGPFVYDLPGGAGNAIVCYGSGSWEYHTFADDISRFNEESLSVSAIVYGTHVRQLAWDGN